MMMVLVMVLVITVTTTAICISSSSNNIDSTSSNNDRARRIKPFKNDRPQSTRSRINYPMANAPKWLLKSERCRCGLMPPFTAGFPLL
jgi:hypothetical protein